MGHVAISFGWFEEMHRRGTRTAADRRGPCRDALAAIPSACRLSIDCCAIFAKSLITRCMEGNAALPNEIAACVSATKFLACSR